VVKNKSGTVDVCRHVQAKEEKHGLDIPENLREIRQEFFGSDNKNEEKVMNKCALY
jgi:hypothetical protein